MKNEEEEEEVVEEVEGKKSTSRKNHVRVKFICYAYYTRGERRNEEGGEGCGERELHDA